MLQVAPASVLIVAVPAGQVTVGVSSSFTVITTWQVVLFAGEASSDTV
jgi:hypothetical protein